MRILLRTETFRVLTKFDTADIDEPHPTLDILKHMLPGFPQNAESYLILEPVSFQ